jgi:hypothetical protein
LRVKIAHHPEPTIAQRRDIDEAWGKMRKLLDGWGNTLADFMPPDVLSQFVQTAVNPEDETLRLPSDFDQAAYRRLGLENLAQIEYNLRVGMAYDTLKKLRNALGLKPFLTRRKRETVGGQAMMLRSEDAIQRASNDVEKWKEAYRRSRTAMICLKGEDNIDPRLQVA